MIIHKIMIIDEIMVSIHIKPDFFKKLYVFNGIHYFLLFFIVSPPNRMKFLEIHVMPGIPLQCYEIPGGFGTGDVQPWR